MNNTSEIQQNIDKLQAIKTQITELNIHLLDIIKKEKPNIYTSFFQACNEVAAANEALHRASNKLKISMQNTGNNEF